MRRCHYINDCGKKVNANQPLLHRPHDKINLESAEGFARPITVAGARGGQPDATNVSAPTGGRVQSTPESSTHAEAVPVGIIIVFTSMRAQTWAARSAASTDGHACAFARGGGPAEPERKFKGLHEGRASVWSLWALSSLNAGCRGPLFISREGVRKGRNGMIHDSI